MRPFYDASAGHTPTKEHSMTWSGVFPAVTTKMQASGVVDLKATQASIERLVQNGVSGVIVLPMLGENATLTQAERDAVVSAAR
ncbi:dihydrodipicolinate synthase family protein, partial [Mesorhizobium sp.]|uniref:dihydrodipicolinate synthase family protein n=2 Tax=Mesorhizobium sp. TaxID=1871066 RepID=UPI003453748A